MAEKPKAKSAATPAKTAKSAKKTKMPFSVKLAFFIVFVCMVLFLPSTIIFIVGMLPSLVATIVDQRPQRAAWLTVGALNFAGVVPAWFTLWETGHYMTNAISLLAEPKTLFIAYSAAGLGWLVYHQVPVIISSLLAGKGERRLKDIEKRQRELLRKWGVEVAGERPEQKG